MTHLTLCVLLGLVSHYNNLLTLTVLNCLCAYGCTVNVGSTNLDAVFCANCDNLVKGNLGVCFNVKLFDEENSGQTPFEKA